MLTDFSLTLGSLRSFMDYISLNWQLEPSELFVFMCVITGDHFILVLLAA